MACLHYLPQPRSILLPARQDYVVYVGPSASVSVLLLMEPLLSATGSNTTPTAPYPSVPFFYCDCLVFSPYNERIYLNGSGFIVSTSTRTLRPIYSWKAELLCVQEWGADIVTYVAFNLIGGTIHRGNQGMQTMSGQ